LDGTYSGVWNYWYNRDRGATLPGGTFQDGWHSVVGTWDGTTRKLYLDGIERDSIAYASPAVGSSSFVVGRTLNDANFNGWLDELLIASRALTPEEVGAYHAYGGTGLPVIPLVFEQEPSGLLANEGASGTLTSLASGANPIGYQWYKDDLLLEGATDRILHWDSLQTSDAGVYFVVASNASLMIPSRKVRVVVRPPADGSLLAQWTFDDGTARDVFGVMDGTLQGGATIVDGRLQLNGVDAYVSTLALPLNVSEKTLVAWVSLANLAQRGGGVMNLQTGDGVTFDAVVYGERQAGKWIAGSDGWSHTQNVGGPTETAPPEQTVMMAIVYRSDNTIALYRNGSAYGAPYVSSSLRTYLAGNGMVEMGCRHGAPCCDKMLAGQIDEARLYDRALTPAEIAALAGSPHLYITTQPQDQWAQIGDTVTFTVAAGSDWTISYQWLKNGVVMNGQTAADLVLASAQLSDTADYSVVVSNDGGSMTSDVVHLAVGDLMGHWKLDDATGLSAADASGNHLNAALVNFPSDDSQWTVGKIGGAMAISTDRRVVMPSNPLLLDQPSFSVAFWMQVANPLGGNSSVISRENNSICESWGLELFPSGQLNFFAFNDSGFIGAVQSAQPAWIPADQAFHHVVLTYDHTKGSPQQLDIYFDGVLASGSRDTGSAQGAPGYDGAPLSLGQRLGACAYPTAFDGLLDDVQFYRKPLNAEEVSRLFQNPGQVLAVPEPGPVRITTIDPESGDVTVTFDAAPGHTYALRYKDSLQDRDWNNVFDGEKTATDTTLSITDYSAFYASPQRFYRAFTVR
jgi:hypothetical protein